MSHIRVPRLDIPPLVLTHTLGSSRDAVSSNWVPAVHGGELGAVLALERATANGSAVLCDSALPL